MRDFWLKMRASESSDSAIKLIAGQTRARRGETGPAPTAVAARAWAAGGSRHAALVISRVAAWLVLVASCHVCTSTGAPALHTRTLWWHGGSAVRHGPRVSRTATTRAELVAGSLRPTKRAQHMGLIHLLGCVQLAVGRNKRRVYTPSGHAART